MWFAFLRQKQQCHPAGRSGGQLQPACQPGRGSPTWGASYGLHRAAAGERVILLPGAWTAAAEFRSRLSLQHQHREGWRDRCSRMLVGFPALLDLAAEQEEEEFYLTQDLSLPSVDVSKKQLIISVPLLYKCQHQRTPGLSAAL